MARGYQATSKCALFGVEIVVVMHASYHRTVLKMVDNLNDSMSLWEQRYSVFSIEHPQNLTALPIFKTLDNIKNIINRTYKLYPCIQIVHTEAKIFFPYSHQNKPSR